MRLRVLRHVLAPFVLVIAAGAASAAPAAAQVTGTGCDLRPHVYETGGGRYLEKAWSDPIDGPFLRIDVDVPSTGVQQVQVRLGGSGMSPNSPLTWKLYSGDNGGFIGNLDGGFADSNCVSNEVTHAISGSEGDSYLLKVTYRPWFNEVNDLVRDQNHVQVFFT